MSRAARERAKKRPELTLSAQLPTSTMASAAEQLLLESEQLLLESQRRVEEAQQRNAAATALVEQETALAATVLPPLPDKALDLIFSLLPGDPRLRCREVSRPWRAFLEQRRHWTLCDLSPSSGVASGVRSRQKLLAAASARAGGQLRVLDWWVRENWGLGFLG